MTYTYPGNKGKIYRWYRRISQWFFVCSRVISAIPKVHFPGIKAMPKYRCSYLIK